MMMVIPQHIMAGCLWLRKCAQHFEQIEFYRCSCSLIANQLDELLKTFFLSGLAIIRVMAVIPIAFNILHILHAALDSHLQMKWPFRPQYICCPQPKLCPNHKTIELDLTNILEPTAHKQPIKLNVLIILYRCCMCMYHCECSCFNKSILIELKSATSNNSSAEIGEK